MLAPIKIFSETLLDGLAAQATASPRKRANLNIHTQDSDLVQRFFVAADQDTYFRPHRHSSKSELALVLRGRFDIVTFDDAGRVTSRHAVGGDTGDIAYEMPSGTWHMLVACTDGSTFLEIKEGPYDRATAAEFAPWAPPEGDATVPQFLAWVRRAGLSERPEWLETARSRT
jgi:cupin fold WbuC family metalloprotein